MSRVKSENIEVHDLTLTGAEYGAALPLHAQFLRIHGIPEGHSVLTKNTMIGSGRAELVIEIDGDPQIPAKAMQQANTGLVGFTRNLFKGRNKLPAPLPARVWQEMLRNAALTEFAGKLVDRFFIHAGSPTVRINFKPDASGQKAVLDANGLPVIESVKIIASGVPNESPAWEGIEIPSHG